ncbi:hypothetical protein QCA50_005356 [Cerrena zonata]|uniref:Peptide hydrolase n=1 Tax=Cerrena zonata TaxID=2478898 RepID=A0AAW0GQW3_9APHY
MTVHDWLIAPLRFRLAQVSIFTVLIYGLVFLSVLVNDQTPDVSNKLNGLNLTQTYEDLHHITARPHPYPSHANDEVHAFILARLEGITEKNEFVHISNDLVSNASYVSGSNRAFYFEGTNILIKIDGTAPGDSDGIVFSAHYDSVSTGRGATDNGMGVASLLQLAEYFSQPSRRPKRDALFLFNNGEEDGLNGVHVFFEHPWSKLVSTFVNLEGAGAGGRPILFRSTSLAPVRAYASHHVSHPFGNSLTVDAFSRGLIRSQTDYVVFEKGIKGEKNGLSGLDIAFYKNRALYHTLFDSISGMGRGEARRSLWIMLDTVRGVGTSLLNEDQADDGGDRGMYFDLFGSTIVTTSRTALFITNIVFLVLGPISTAVLLAWVLVLSNKQTNSNIPEEDVSSTWVKVKKVLFTALGWGRFWIALLVSVAVHTGFCVGYIKLNPFVIHGHPYWVLVNTLSLTFLSLVIPLSIFHYFFPSPPTSQKLAVLLEIFFLTWVLLVIATVALNQYSLGGLYWITAWYLCAWLASLFGLAEAAVRAVKGGEAGGKGELDLVGERSPTPVEEDADGIHRVRGVLYQINEEPDEERAEGHLDSEPIETEPTEITPLIRQRRRRSTGGREYIVGVDDEAILVEDSTSKGAGFDEVGWWILQYLALVPFPLILVFQILVLLLHSLSQTLVDGSSPTTVYATLSALSVLSIIGLTPFAHKIHGSLILVVIIVFAASLTYTWTAFPFTQGAPLKLFFQQKLTLDVPSLRPTIEHKGEVVPSVRAVTTLVGPHKYVDKSVIPELPSSWGKPVDCSMDQELRRGLLACNWESDLIPTPGGNSSVDAASISRTNHHSDWLHATASRTEAATATFTVRGTNTRSCRLKFDQPISGFQVRNGGRIQPGYEIPKSGLKDIVMWSRTWDNEFVVDVQWSASGDEPLTGYVACEWVEYATASAGSSYVATSGQIPALEEVLQYLPLWATATKWTYGLVEVEARFSI